MLDLNYSMVSYFIIALYFTFISNSNPKLEAIISVNYIFIWIGSILCDSFD